MESFEVRGQWWLPNDEKNRVPGVLRFNPSDGAILELEGRLGDPIKEATLGERNPAIVGVDVHGKLYTLLSPSLQSFKIGGMFTSSYMSLLLLKGADYASEEDVRIRKVTARFWSLEEWVNLFGIKVEIRHSPPEVMVQYSEPPKMTIDIDSRLRLCLEFALISFAPEEYREWLREKLEYSNQATLRQRIKELWDNHRDVFEKYFGKRREFIAKVIDTRNYYVHQDESLKDRALRGRDLRRMNRSLFLLLGLLCTLDLLGMSQGQVEMLLERHRGLLEGLWRADGS